MNRVLITGVNGLLGQNLLRVLGGGWNEVHGTDLQAQPHSGLTLDSYTAVDLTDPSSLVKLVSRVAPEWILHTAAFTDVDGSEEQAETAFAVNAAIPQHLVEICAARDIKLLHISTDYIFDGTQGPYRESDLANPRGVYAQSKYAGELAVTESSAHWVVVRPNILYGAGKELKSSFVHWLIRELRSGNRVRIVDDQFNNPTYAYRLAEVCEILMANESSGIWHFGSRDVVSRYEFALKIANVFGLEAERIEPVSTEALQQKAPRPMRSGLVTDKLAQSYQVPILTAEEELGMLKEELNVS